MSDDLNKKIKQITDILGQDNIPDNLKSLLSLLVSPGTKQEPVLSQPEVPLIKEERREKLESDDNLELVRKIRNMMDRVSSTNDPGINLLNAIRPFLKKSRQNKLNKCIQIMHVSRLARYMDDNDKSGN